MWSAFLGFVCNKIDGSIKVSFELHEDQVKNIEDVIQISVFQSV